MPLADGATFAGYTILRVLGSGGMGEVYLIRTKVVSGITAKR
jgi:serine/threonine-protein kinase